MPRTAPSRADEAALCCSGRHANRRHPGDAGARAVQHRVLVRELDARVGRALARRRQQRQRSGHHLRRHLHGYGTA